MLRCSCYVKEMKSIQFFNPSSVIYMRAQVNSSTSANICWLIQAFKYQYCGFQVHFKWSLVYNLKTKSDFLSKCPHYIMGYIINCGSMLFLLSLVFTFAYIDYSLCQIWSVYMQNLLRLWPFQNMLVPGFPRGWSVAKHFWWVYIPVVSRQDRQTIRHGPLTRYAKLQVAHAPGMPGTFSPPPISNETAS